MSRIPPASPSSHAPHPTIPDDPDAACAAPARYFPVRDTPLRMEAGLKPFGTDFGNGDADRRFFQIDREWRRYVEGKRIAPADRQRVIEREDLTAAHARVLAWLGETLRREHPELAAGIDAKASSTSSLADAYAQIALRVQEDLTVMHRGADGRGAAIAVHVCFPSGWRPERIPGQTFGAIHAPVPDFADAERAERSMMTSMVDRGPFVRFVWTIAADDHLDRHPDAGLRTPWAPGARGWLRVERQTTIGFPEVDASLFLIRVYLYPFEGLSTDERRTLAGALEVMPEEVLRYKGLEGAPRDVALGLLRPPSR